MRDAGKTKAQLIDELGEMRQKISELESSVSQYQQAEKDQGTLLANAVEQRARTEKLLQASNALNHSLNYSTVLDSALQQVSAFLPHDAACIMLVEGGMVRMSRWQGYMQFEDDSPVSLVMSINEVPALNNIQETGQSLVVSNVTTDDPWAYDPGTTWTKSSISVPIYLRDKIFGFLKVDSSTPGFFNQADGVRLQEFVNQLSLSLNNAQRYNQGRQEITRQVVVLKQERNFINAVLNAAGALVMVVSPQGRILRFNRTCEQITGYSLDEVRGEYFWDLFLLPNESARIKATFEALQVDQSRSSYECHWLTKEGAQCLIAWTNNVLLGSEGQVEYIISTGNDITERRQLEERLMAIHQLGRELNLIRDEVDIFNIALETASFLLQFKSYGYGVVDEVTGDFEYYFYPIRGVPRVVELRLPLDTEQRIEDLTNRSGSTTNVLDTTELTGYAWLTAPMKIGERIIGVLDVKSDRQNHFTANDQQLLQTLADQTAVAIENARLHRETHQRVDELSTMSMISQAITSTLNLGATLTFITDHAIRLLGAMAASVVLHDEAKSDLWFHAASGGVPEFVRGVRMEAGQGIVGWVIQNGEPALIPDVSQDPRFFSKIDHQTGFTTRSVICVPLQTETQTTGAIEVMNKNNGSFTQEDLRLLSWMATPATIAIENARLFEAEHTARKQAEILREATTTLTSTLHLDRVLNSILVHLERVVPCNNAFVFLQNGDWLQAVAGRDSLPAGKQIMHRRSPADNTVYQEIRDTCHPVILPDVKTNADIEMWGSSSDVRSWMGVPLMVQDQVIGCLTLDSKDIAAYDKIEAGLAQAFANQAAVAIQNAQLFEQVRTGHKQLQSLSHRLVQAQETERRHIARELHDEAGQALTSLMVGLRLLEQKADDPEIVVVRVAELKSTTNDVLENLHRLAMDLRPASLDHLGLTAALRQYIETFGRKNSLIMQYEVIGLDDKRLPSAVETNLYRIVQEALTNSVRHARATRVDVLLEQRDNQVITIIEDNGVGFDTETIGQTGRLGLLGMRERAEMLGGSLVIESTIGTSTTIYVEIPYDHSHSNR